MSSAESATANSLLQTPTTALRASGARRVDGPSAMNRSERIGFWLYVGMGISGTGVVVAAALSALVS